MRRNVMSRFVRLNRSFILHSRVFISANLPGGTDLGEERRVVTHPSLFSCSFLDKFETGPIYCILVNTILVDVFSACKLFKHSSRRRSTLESVIDDVNQRQPSQEGDASMPDSSLIARKSLAIAGRAVRMVGLLVRVALFLFR